MANTRSLQYKAVFLGAVPTLIVSICLGSYFLFHRFDSLDTSLSNAAHNLTSSYAPTYQPLITQDRTRELKARAVRLLEAPHVRAVIIYGADKKPLVRAGPEMRPTSDGNSRPPIERPEISTLPHKTARSLRTLAPVLNDPNAGNTGDNASSAEPVGWLEIELDLSQTTIEKYKHILFVTSVILLSLFFSIILSWYFSKEVSTTLSHLYRAIKDMAKGKQNVAVQENSFGELKSLQHAFNTLSTSIQDKQEKLQQNVNQTTEDLRETLETIEIQNVELDLARKAALEASRVKSAFLANMSHEIRTPLNGVIGFTNLLRKGELSPRQRDYLETILKSSESLLGIINDILDFSKIEAGKLILDQVPLSLQEIIEDVLTLLSPMAYEKQLEQVSLFYSDVPTRIIGDPLRIKQILTNLVNNAIKFTDTGSVIIRVMLEEQQENTATIKIAITDTGVGLTVEQQKALFRTFQQADTSTARRFGGTGLGLAITKHLVAQMDGKVGLESTEGEGSTFWFTIKAKINRQSTQALPSPNQPGNCTLAIYDKLPELRSAFKNTLGKRNIRIIELNSLRAVTELMDNPKQAPPDFMGIIIGIHPQASKPEEIATIIRNNPHRIPILMAGNTVDQASLAESLEMPLPPFISKPVCEMKLFEALDRLILFDKRVCDKQLETTGAPDHRASTIDDTPVQILVVDDNPANLKLLTAILTELGATVTSCDTGMKALEIMDNQRFDLVLMDIQMPVMDGLETTTRIRTSEKDFSRRTPIVAVTAHTLASEKEGIINAGMDDYVTKPIDENNLLAIIHKWTGRDLTRNYLSQFPVNDTSPPQVVDMTLGTKLANGNKQLANDLLRMLLDSLASERLAIQHSLDRKSYSQLLEVVHRLHGASQLTGATPLQDAACGLETNLKLPSREHTESLTLALLEKIDQLLQWEKMARNKVTEGETGA